MKKSYLMAVDMGVSFVKVGIYDTRARCIHSVSDKVPNTQPEAGVFMQKADDYLQIVLHLIKRCVQDSRSLGKHIECIGFSAAMGGAMGIDRDFNVAADWSIVSDQRFNPYVFEMLDQEKSLLIGKSGTNFPVFAAKILWWKHAFPQLHKKVFKYIFLCAYIAGKLANIDAQDAFIDRSHLQWTALADLSAGSFSEELCQSFKIDQKLLPKVVDSYQVIGKLDKKMAGLCALKEGIPLIAGAGDKPAGTVGAGLLSKGLLIDESASFAALSLCTDQFVPDHKRHTLETLMSPIRGLYLPSIFINGSGITHQWFKDTFCREEEKAAQKRSISVFKMLDQQAEKINPGSDKLLAIGLLAGRGYPFDPNIKGMWINYDWSHNKAHFWRSLLESFAYEYASALKIMKDNYPDIRFDEIRVIGGAARSDLWNQIKCDVSGIPYVRLNRDDFTLLGDAMLAGHGVGIYPDLRKISNCFFETGKRYEPDEAKHAYYKKFVNVYEDLFGKIRGMYTELKKIPFYDKDR